ncbi:hypothetical protein TCAL_13276 [Tigriopus californicus]|uniref:CUB domain-containing protein n=1 Tax=Tigriopus californicus TaxID=6832 RepID=A0A553PM10_TIGCA|nr:hypothetical protein TCAL_13276 [Tigriopus californicus]
MSQLLSLFSIVQFKQGPCVQASDTSKRGICMTTQQCTDRSGSASGNCAAGFGVCCGFTLSTCGSTVNENPNFPSATATGSCEYIFSRVCEGYCSIQYSANTFNLLGDTAATPEANAETIACPDTVVFIPNLVNSMHCGSKFSTIDADTISGVVTSQTTPFQVLTIFKDAFGTLTDTMATVGYDLQFTQQPC